MSTQPPSEHGPDGLRVVVLASLLVFTSSLFIMTLELTAARLVAQYLGVSLYTWTSVIGVVLAGITLGNFIGGQIADVRDPRRTLPVLFLLSSVLSLSVLFLVDWMGSWSRPEYLSWPLWILRNITLVFLLPSTLLGMISPVAAKIALEARDRIGSTVGTLYAAGAAGSIVGTFLTGYLLIDLFGSKTIVSVVAIGLALIGTLLAVGQRVAPGGFLVAWIGIAALSSSLAVGPWPWAERWGHFFGLRFDTSHLLYQDESSYFAIEVYEAEELENTRVLALDHLVHSYVAMDDPTRLEYAYETVYAAVTARLYPRSCAEGVAPCTSQEPIRAMFIGGGGYTFPRYLETHYPRATIDVAEIDPAVTRAAREALGLPPPGQTRIRSHHMDARNFVRDLVERSGGGGRYDLVYGDAFNDLGVPFHLTTRGFNEEVAEVLAPGGVYMINVIDIYRPGFGRFLGAFVNTLRRTFPFVYVFSGEPDGVSEERDTFTVVASRRSLDLQRLGRGAEPVPQGTIFASIEEGVFDGGMETVLERGQGLVLTDDHAPVDNLLARVFAAQ